MTPAWWITVLSLGLNVVNVVWMLILGKPWAAGYWACAFGITVCVQQALAK